MLPKAEPYGAGWRCRYGAQGQLLKAGIFVADEGIAYVGTLGNRGQAQALRQHGGHILEAVDSEVNGAVSQLRFNLLSEQSLAADLCQRHI